MTFREVILSINGLRNRDKMLQEWHRRSAFIVASTNMGGKSVINKMEKLWPIEGVDRAKVNQKALDQLRKFREMEALKIANVNEALKIANEKPAT